MFTRFGGGFVETSGARFFIFFHRAISKISSLLFLGDVFLDTGSSPRKFLRARIHFFLLHVRVSFFFSGMVRTILPPVRSSSSIGQESCVPFHDGVAFSVPCPNFRPLRPILSRSVDQQLFVNRITPRSFRTGGRCSSTPRDLTRAFQDGPAVLQSAPGCGYHIPEGCENPLFSFGDTLLFPREG